MIARNLRARVGINSVGSFKIKSSLTHRLYALIKWYLLLLLMRCLL
jgi:hypothetical protein